jgi:WD40 repeat protein
MTMRHGGAPIESHLVFPSGGVGITVGGPILRVWDLNMGRCIRALSNHQKTVTCATFDGTRGRVLTGGLDAMVKVYDVEEWKVVHSMRYPAPVLSLAVSVSPPLQMHLGQRSRRRAYRPCARYSSCMEVIGHDAGEDECSSADRAAIREQGPPHRQ